MNCIPAVQASFERLMKIYLQTSTLCRTDFRKLASTQRMYCFPSPATDVLTSH